jgi:alpha-aminoadipic semialdehyde synthase
LIKYIEDHKEDKERTKKIVICVYAAKDLVRLKEPVEGQPFDKAHYYKNPNLYQSKFFEHLPYVQWLVNGIYWEPKYPRVLNNLELKNAVEEGNCRLMGVCDISADYNGSIEFTSKFTSIEEPFLVWDAKNMSFRDKIADADNNCILFHSVDHLPAEMPKEASNHFGE